jgi:hypothetical protein
MHRLSDRKFSGLRHHYCRGHITRRHAARYVTSHRKCDAERGRCDPSSDRNLVIARPKIYSAAIGVVLWSGPVLVDTGVAYFLNDTPVRQNRTTSVAAQYGITVKD